MAVSTNEYFGIGWMHGKCCALLDRGVDPRSVEVPELIEEYAKVKEYQDAADRREDARDRLWYYVDNPCRWWRYDQQMSDLLKDALAPLESPEQKQEEAKPDRPLGYYWVIGDEQGEWEIARYDNIPGEGNFWFLIEDPEIYSDEDIDCIGSFVAELGTQG